VDIGATAKLELVDKFCYLGDMLSVDGDADAAAHRSETWPVRKENVVALL